MNIPIKTRLKDAIPFKGLVHDILSRDTYGLDVKAIHLMMGSFYDQDETWEVRMRLFDALRGSTSNTTTYAVRSLIAAIGWGADFDTLTTNLTLYFRSIGELNYYENIFLGHFDIRI